MGKSEKGDLDPQTRRIQEIVQLGAGKQFSCYSLHIELP